MLDRVAVGRSFAEQHHIGVAHDFAATGRHQMRQAVAAQVLAPVVQILRLRRAAVVHALFDSAADMVAVDREHRLHVAVARGTNE